MNFVILVEPPEPEYWVDTEMVGRCYADSMRPAIVRGMQRLAEIREERIRGLVCEALSNSKPKPEPGVIDYESVRQILRDFRKDPSVFDFIDTLTATMKSRQESRRRVYEALAADEVKPYQLRR